MIKPITISKSKFTIAAVLLVLIAAALRLSPIVTVFLISILAYIKFRNIKCGLNTLLLLFLLNFTAGYFIIKEGVSILYLPFAAVAMLSAILFNQLEIPLLISLASGISVASLIGGNFYVIAFFLISGMAGSILVRDVRRRTEIIRAGLIIGILQIAILVILDNLKIFDSGRYMVLGLNGIISSFIVLGTLPLFEILFNTTTNISLLELADFNHPLLQRMIMEAPGTYHHSLIVGNLSEAACRAVGANSLLARIGAYYHDIGKIEKAHYFSENQIHDNKHEELSPTMSKMVIMNHVKEGVELAKKHKLNPRIIDFITQHHGKSLVYYFYRRALEALEEDQDVKEEGFRYPGPRPDSRETAIVLLADSVEAATKALDEPTPAKIEELVHKIINNKFIDGQLDECELTLKDLEKISEVFVRILTGIYHSRVPYPETNSKIENNNKKPAKENPRLSEKDKKGSA